MRDFTCNERVLASMLQTGYIDKIVTDHAGKKAFVDFLNVILKRSNSTNLTIEAARAVAVLSADLSGRTQLVKGHITEALIPYLQLDHEEIILAVGRALVNLTGDNAKAKVEIIVGNGVRMVVQHNHLVDKGPEVIKTMCALIKNCLNSDEVHRKKIAQDGVAVPLTRLLQNSMVDGLEHKADVMVKAAGALWNLCASEDGKEAVMEAVRSSGTRLA